MRFPCVKSHLLQDNENKNFAGRLSVSNTFIYVSVC
uniref:Uncharacterized protein n=1 Tax=Anguilla anguilla TaxID=7936 RepID=A0A0E9W6F6_ANGAN